jgi:hypothetical protein
LDDESAGVAVAEGFVETLKERLAIQAEQEEKVPIEVKVRG